MTDDLAAIRNRIDKLNSDCMRSLDTLMDDIESGRIETEVGLRRGDELALETQNQVRALEVSRDKVLRSRSRRRFALLMGASSLLALGLYLVSLR